MILILDDEGAVADNLKSIIEDCCNHDVVTAFSDQAASSLLKTGLIDLVFLDYNFQKRQLDCNQLAEMAKHKDTTTVLFTGDPSVPRESFDYYLEKPFEYQQVKQILNQTVCNGEHE